VTPAARHASLHEPKALAAAWATPGIRLRSARTLTASPRERTSRSTAMTFAAFRLARPGGGSIPASRKALRHDPKSLAAARQTYGMSRLTWADETDRPPARRRRSSPMTRLRVQ
jgi:hypothetical protein